MSSRSSAKISVKISKKRKRGSNANTSTQKGQSQSNHNGAEKPSIPSILSGNISIASSTNTAVTKTTKSTPDEFFPDALDIELPSNIELAMQSLKQRFSYGTCDLYYSDAIPFCMKEMVNAALMSSSGNKSSDQVLSVDASTGFDIELKELCTSGKIRMIQLQGLDGEDDVALFETADYVKGVKDAQTHAKEASEQDNKVIQLFLEVISSFHLTYVFGSELVEAMKEVNERSADCEYLLNEDKWIDVLINSQLLLPRRLNSAIHVTKGKETYWITLPKLGMASSLIAEGRKRMILKLKRAPYKELKRKQLEETARGGMMGPFHVRDLVARGVVRVKKTANGQFIKLIV
ncbi:hypothetical protein CTEN210_06165 [Chaetoceros tenuissimus]|uniref:Uncharacterized protein n=1 Tax=Chaetoceros tenuissimus TaxID=426638 RepID=A0AAD3CPZ6_9STRA|nr:hypothetical protein CTEN210_06165 [Chaetoceros tenuissimus]